MVWVDVVYWLMVIEYVMQWVQVRYVVQQVIVWLYVLFWYCVCGCIQCQFNLFIVGQFGEIWWVGVYWLVVFGEKGDEFFGNVQKVW